MVKNKSVRKNHNKEKLQKYLLPLSQCDDPDGMMKEWEFMYFHYAAARPVGELAVPEGGWLPNVHYVPNKTACGVPYVSGIDCPCSHANLMRLCYIHNKITQHVVIIGSDCVNRFMSISAPTGIWGTLEKMYSRVPVILTVRMESVLHKFTLDNYETKFLLKMRGQYLNKESELTVPQQNFLVSLNLKILRQVNYHHLNNTDPAFATLPDFSKWEKVDQLLVTIRYTLDQRKAKREVQKAEREKRRQKRSTALT